LANDACQYDSESLKGPEQRRGGIGAGTAIIKGNELSYRRSHWNRLNLQQVDY
jgi:hypothetical protein